MKPVLVFLALAALSAGPLGCDRLPGRGAEGEPCFGNDSCDEGLICDTAHDRCCPAGGCPNDCGECAQGTYCVVDTCLPCNTSSHCGSDCESCDWNLYGMACREESAGVWACGCAGEDDCRDGYYCDLEDGSCVNCDMDDHCGTWCEDCTGGPEGDTCEWDPDESTYVCACTSSTPCQDGSYCDGSGNCLDCDQDRFCGADCLDCAAAADGPLCIWDDGAQVYHCGCMTDEDCTGTDICPAFRCEQP